MPIAMHGHVSRERLLHLGLWGAQVLLASVFAAMALFKLLSPPERLIEMMAWTASAPVGLIYAFAGLELMGALLVAAPLVAAASQRIAGITALVFVALMLAASVIHATSGELRMIPLNLAVGALAAFVGWGRLAHKSEEAAETR